MEVSISLDPAAPDGIDTFLADINKIQNIAIHLDFMDGKYVPRQNLTLEQYHRIIENSAHPVDAHLMIANPEREWQKYFSHKLRSFTFHVEAAPDLTTQQALIEKIHKAGVDAGIAIDKPTNVDDINPEILQLCDTITVMTIKAGLSGQQFQPELLEKVTQIKKQYPHCRIIVDGGINTITAPQAAQAGADTLVSGAYVFNAKDRAAAIKSLI